MKATDRPVHGPGGQQYGTVDTTCWPSLEEMPEPLVAIHLDNGRDVCVPTESLIEQRDGSYYLTLSREELNAAPAPTPREDGCWPCRHGPPPGQLGVSDHQKR